MFFLFILRTNSLSPTKVIAKDFCRLNVKLWGAKVWTMGWGFSMGN